MAPSQHKCDISLLARQPLLTRIDQIARRCRWTDCSLCLFFVSQSLDGFVFALNTEGRFLYISETVSIYLGLSQVSPRRPLAKETLRIARTFRTRSNEGSALLPFL